jgi:hypothetical protein
MPFEGQRTVSLPVSLEHPVNQIPNNQTPYKEKQYEQVELDPWSRPQLCDRPC